MDKPVLHEAFQVAAGFSGSDFNHYMQYLFIMLTVLWALELFAVWSTHADVDDVRGLVYRIVGVGVVITLVMILVGS